MQRPVPPSLIKTGATSGEIGARSFLKTGGKEHLRRRFLQSLLRSDLSVEVEAAEVREAASE